MTSDGALWAVTSGLPEVDLLAKYLYFVRLCYCPKSVSSSKKQEFVKFLMFYLVYTMEMVAI